MVDMDMGVFWWLVSDVGVAFRFTKSLGPSSSVRVFVKTGSRSLGFTFLLVLLAWVSAGARPRD